MEEDAILILNGIAGTPGGIRTPDLLLRRQPLYPSELQAHALGSLTPRYPRGQDTEDWSSDLL